MRHGSRPPDVVGYPLEQALRILAAAGWTSCDISETQPPRRRLGGERRVVRQRVESGGRIMLVACGERVEGAAAGDATPRLTVQRASRSGPRRRLRGTPSGPGTSALPSGKE